MEPKVKIWVAFDEQTKFGEGRAQLLESIDRLGSIKRAVEQFGMSYRAAWGYIRELEHAAGFQLVLRTPGRGSLGGTRLTGDGRKFLKQYRAFQHRLEGGVKREFRRAFTPRRTDRTAPKSRRAT